MNKNATKKPVRKKIFSPRVIKIMVMALAVIVQAAVIVVPSIFFHDFIVHINWIFEIISALVVLYILKSDINPVYKIPWIVVIMLIPVFGWIFYLVYGRAHFGRKETQRVCKTADACRIANDFKPHKNEELKKYEPDIVVQANYLLKKADAPAYRNTESTFFALGDDMFPVMLAELEKAEHYIFMEYFIIQEGKMLNPILDILERKAQEGLDVRFMYDSLGSIFKAPIEMVERLKKRGIKFFEFNTFRTIFDSRYNNRDHRKICVIDGKVGFTGGVNLADEYINQKEVYGHWKDTAIMIKGDAVWSMTTMFLALWDSSTVTEDDFSKFYVDEDFSSLDDGYVIPYTDYPIDDEPVGKNVYFNMITKAKKYVYIMTPYLILDNIMVAALVTAAKNGIDVRIMTPGIPDKKITFMLTQSHYERLIKAGVKIYEYTPGFVHAKIFVSDDETAVVGSINLDYRSLTHHFENAIWMYKTKAIFDIKKDYLLTEKKCKRIPLEDCIKIPIYKRILLPVLKLFSPLF